MQHHHQVEGQHPEAYEGYVNMCVCMCVYVCVYMCMYLCVYVCVCMLPQSLRDLLPISSDQFCKHLKTSLFVSKDTDPSQERLWLSGTI